MLGCSLSFGYAQQADKGISSTDNINRIINTLASDEMRGRSALNLEDIGRAADFIAQEFKNIGLKPYAEDNFRQTFQVNQSKTRLQEITWNKKKLADDQFLIMGNVQNLQWDQHSKISKLQIAAGDDFSQKFREFMQQNPDDAIVLVDKNMPPSWLASKKYTAAIRLQPVNKACLAALAKYLSWPTASRQAIASACKRKPAVCRCST